MAAEHLLELGPRHYAFVDVGDVPLSRDRLAGFQERLAAALPGARVACRFDTGRGLRDWLARLPKPTAVFCANDHRGREVADAAVQLSLRIPRDVAVLGVDNDPFDCEIVPVALSSVVVPFAEIGARAAECLLALLRGEPPPAAPILIPPERVEVRVSTDPFATDDELVAEAVRWLRQPDRSVLNVGELADRLGVSRRKLELRFKAAGLGTIHGVMHDVRMNRAAVLLRQTRRSVAEISRAIGLADHQRFAALFRQRFGAPPGRWRRTFQ